MSVYVRENSESAAKPDISFKHEPELLSEDPSDRSDSRVDVYRCEYLRDSR